MVVWAGTDDGNLQVTRDGEKASWTNVVEQHHRVAEERVGLERRATEHFAAGTIYATFDLHTFGDMTAMPRTARPTSARAGLPWSQTGSPRCAGTHM